MAALIQQEQDGKKDEKDDSDEYSGSAKSEHERRDVFDSDFDEDEKDESESAEEREEEGSGFDDDQKEAKRLPRIAFRWIQSEEREKEEGKERIECKKSQPVSGKRRRRAAAENFETPMMATDAPPPKRPKPDGTHVDTCGACRLRLGAPVEAGPWARDMTILACTRCPRAFHARCLGLVDMDARAAPTKLPWLDPQGHWLCAACEGEDEEGERHALDLVSAAALASMRRVSERAGASPRRKATAARKGALEVVDALLGHDFGRYFRELRAVREALDADAPAPTQRAARVAKPRKPPRKPGKTLFPTKLYEIVSRHSDIVRWDREQRHLVIEDDKRLVAEVMPAFFNGTGNYTSFARQLNYYGFNRLDAAKRQGDEPLVFFNKNTSVKEVSDLEKLVRWIAPDKDAESGAVGGGGEDADIDDDDASDAWAATSWARTAIAIKRVRATLQFEDEAQDAHSRMAKELSALAEVGFARMVRPHLPEPVVEDLYQH